MPLSKKGAGMRRSRSVLVLAATMAVGGSPGLAHAAAGWTKISTDDKSSIDSPSLALAGSQAVAALPAWATAAL